MTRLGAARATKLWLRLYKAEIRATLIGVGVLAILGGVLVFSNPVAFSSSETGRIVGFAVSRSRTLALVDVGGEQLGVYLSDPLACHENDLIEVIETTRVYGRFLHGHFLETASPLPCRSASPLARRAD
ncbi:MAG: hypothetical protein JWM33_2261 [Caulobacteraceae bacterium]|nr:hypothetical protein [Caulobacteraceae bacterium]